MAKTIYVNLPVKDPKRSKEFFEKLGFKHNPVFSNESATCIIIGENIYAMLLEEKFFKMFTKKEISDATKTTEVLIAIDLNSREEVDDIVRKAIEAGGTTYMESQDHGWMYQHSFADLDGHQWEVGYMDVSQMPEEMKSKASAV